MPKVLLADQSEDYVELVRAAIESRFDGLEITAAHERDAAERWLRSSANGLALIHIKIEGQLTLDLVETTKRERPAISVITITEYDLPEYRQAALSRGADCVIAKQTPQAVDEIAACVGAFLELLPVD